MGSAAKATSARSAPGPRPVCSGRQFWVMILVLSAFCLLLKLPTLGHVRREPDEQIYWQLAEKLATGQAYNLQGTEILPQLAPGMYDHELFHHPPLFPALLVPFVLFGSPQSAILLPWLGHLLCLVALALIGRRIVARAAPRAEATDAVLWLPLLGVALDPVLTFVARKLWIDAVLVGLLALAIACLYLARDDERPGRLWLAGGILFGLAALAKLTALLVAPAAAYLVWTGSTHGRARWQALALSAGPVLLMVGAWLLVFYAQFGVFNPPWIKPDAYALQHFPMLRLAVQRPALYFVRELLFIYPLLLIAFCAFIGHGRRLRDPETITAALWFGVCLFALSYMGATGYGFQVRFLAPLVPAIYIVPYVLLARSEQPRPWLQLAMLLGMVFAGMNGVYYVVMPRVADLTSILSRVRIF